MQNPSDSRPADQPIGGCFLVDAARPLPDAGGGLPAFVTTDLRSGRSDLIAVAVARTAPARAAALKDLAEPVDNLLCPLGHGAAPGPGGVPGYFVICPAPPGPPLSANPRPWTEAALIALVLRPAAQALSRLEARGVTHRAIRADNVFSAGAGQPIFLGSAWSAPPALHQPPAYEPFYSLMCHPAGRGNGSIADDVYALGCLLIALATGTAPLAGLDAAAVLRRKLEFGSFAAVLGDMRLPPVIADLARGMLAEDPDHRPTPAMLLDPATARGRRVAARPPRRAPRALTIGTTTAWDARTLAQAIGKDPASGMQALRDGSIADWLRRGLGDSTLCARIEDIPRQQAGNPRNDATPADVLLAMRVVTTIEPLAPLCWNGIGLWPDGLGSAIAAATDGDPALLTRLEELVATEAIAIWAALREERCDLFALLMETRSHTNLLRIRIPVGGMARLNYALNPLQPCGGAIGQTHWVTTLDGVAPAMEAIVQASGDPFDADAIGFIAARAPRGLDMEVNALATHQGPGFPVMPWLRILSHIQGRHAPRPLPALARWIVGQAEPLAARWKNRERRAAVSARLASLGESGLFAPIVTELDDASSLAVDANGSARVAATIAQIDAELSRIAQDGASRAALAARYGQEIAAGVGLTALAAALILAAAG